MALLAAALLLVAVQMFMTASLVDDNHELRNFFWVTASVGFAAAVLFLVDLAALVVTLRGRRLLAQYRQERVDWRETRQSQGSLLRRR
jgi:hypothetical protein